MQLGTVLHFWSFFSISIVVFDTFITWCLFKESSPERHLGHSAGMIRICWKIFERILEFVLCQPQLCGVGQGIFNSDKTIFSVSVFVFRFRLIKSYIFVAFVSWVLVRLNCIFEGKEGLAQCVESKIFLARQKQGDVENINIEFREMSGVSVIINSSFNERINAESNKHLCWTLWNTSAGDRRILIFQNLSLLWHVADTFLKISFWTNFVFPGHLTSCAEVHSAFITVKVLTAIC